MADLSTTAAIAEKNSEKAKLNREIVALKVVRQEWYAQTQNVSCKGTQVQKRNCAKDLDDKRAKVAYYDSEIAARNTAIANLDREVNLLEAKATTDNRVNIVLADQGKSGEAMKIEAIGNAAATQAAAQQVAEAQAEGILKLAAVEAAAAETDNKAKKTRNMIFIAAGTLLLLCLIILVVKKIKSKKS